MDTQFYLGFFKNYFYKNIKVSERNVVTYLVSGISPESTSIQTLYPHGLVLAHCLQGQIYLLTFPYKVKLKHGCSLIELTAIRKH